VKSYPITIINRLGLHARAATRLVHCASSWQSIITISKGDKTVNGKSIMGVLMLAASQGTEITLTADGEDEDQALSGMSELINNKFGEDE
jgi:phosphocarrier protein HPr